MKSFTMIVAIAAALTLAPEARADEVGRDASGGSIIYEDDQDDVAMLSFDNAMTESRAMLYVPGLAGNAEERGTFFGYWIAIGAEGYCGAQLEGPDGTKSTGWGNAIISFDRPDFPTGFSALLGSCFDVPFQGLRAEVEQR